ncbi:hypothetical protein COU57_03060 [Candidatus Pacearchaeota archaeon CG10_big_fil_rev_8_21_14_0_10_32_14]|nr:MAG: hypothetical protein COU57_03060 [Candidatus Pacearchaeota archaeon CG10_big_fil_rev_8_21_14_0_10_32_14]
MERKIENKNRYVQALIIGSIIFLLGFGITFLISYLEFKRISQLHDNVAYEIFVDKIDFTLFGTNMCPDTSLDVVSEDLHFQGRMIDALEKKLGKHDSRVLYRKKFYTLVELEHYEFIKDLQKDCALNLNTILFFYSNQKDYITESEEVGRLLGVVYTGNLDNTVIYSFDMDLDSELVKKLMEKYDVTDPNTIIINEKDKVVKPTDVNEIEDKLK